MKYSLSQEDRRFTQAFQSGALLPAEFDHRAHVRLAYVFLSEHDTETATSCMRDALVAYLKHHGIDASKYHETLTRAWILAVRHFMERTGDTPSADAFIDANPLLLDSRIMLTHYSAELLFSPQARAGFIEPDLEIIPGHTNGSSPRRRGDARRFAED